MNKIKIGDRARFNQNYPYGGSLAKSGDTGKVTYVSSRGDYISVALDKGGSAGGAGAWRVDRIAASTTPAFKLGDRIISLENYGSVVRKGDKGVINYVNSAEAGGNVLVSVEFDKHGVVAIFAKRLKLDDTTVPKAAHVFKVGDKGLTRDGESYGVLQVIEGVQQPLVVRVTDKTKPLPTIETYSKDGVYYIDSGESRMDLLPPPKKTVTTYLNVYASGRSCGHPSAAAAIRSHNLGAIVVAHPVTIELP